MAASEQTAAERRRLPAGRRRRRGGGDPVGITGWKEASEAISDRGRGQRALQVALSMKDATQWTAYYKSNSRVEIPSGNFSCMSEGFDLLDRRFNWNRFPISADVPDNLQRRMTLLVNIWSLEYVNGPSSTAGNSHFLLKFFSWLFLIFPREAILRKFWWCNSCATFPRLTECIFTF